MHSLGSLDVCVSDWIRQMSFEKAAFIVLYCGCHRASHTHTQILYIIMAATQFGWCFLWYDYLNKVLTIINDVFCFNSFSGMFTTTPSHQWLIHSKYQSKYLFFIFLVFLFNIQLQKSYIYSFFLVNCSTRIDWPQQYISR